ncbi:zeta toxin family protein [Alkalihalobacterium alkalinitrilicum]|uniref:zeta toxin family protein n=1 Tax=Alkalihalobacterium alkalinitrilicum TaxID=427920 RepID=UPI001EE3FFF3|nr:zeta toxin family protein [Alkalihalobacterium alkalinitrilicum]
MGGGTATGKTKMRKTFIMKEIKKFPDEFCIVDADEIKAEIPEYHMYLKSDKANAASLVHKETDLKLSLPGDA